VTGVDGDALEPPTMCLQDGAPGAVVVEHRDDLRERDAGLLELLDPQRPDQLVGAVGAVPGAGIGGGRGEQADRLVVAHRPRRDADAGGELADPHRRPAAAR
jgi:hypothetical protein